MKKRFNAIDFVIFALYLALFKIYAVPQLVQQGYKVVFLVAVFWYFFRNMERKRFLNMTIPYGCVVILSTVLGFFSGWVGLANIVHAVTYAACLLALYMLCLHCREQNYMMMAAKRLLQITALYCGISVLSIIIQGHSADGTSITYFFGNKFATSYYFIMFAALVYMVYYEYIMKGIFMKLAFSCLAVSVVLICNYVYCTTAVLAALVLVVAPLLPEKLRNFLMHPLTIMGCVVAVAVLPLLIDPIMNNKLVQFVVQDVLGENLALTGRRKIYTALADIIDGNILLGYGYGNRVVEKVVSFGNAQNGFLQLAVDYGVLGGVAFVAMLLRCVLFPTEKRRYWPVYVLMYTMIIASIVEISYNYIFFLAIFVLRWAQTEKEQHGVLFRLVEDHQKRKNNKG